jgi:hypothetical protein
VLGNEPDEPWQIALSGSREPQPARRAGDELCPDRLLQLGDALGDDRRRGPEVPRGRGEAAEAGDTDEGIDIEQIVDGAALTNLDAGSAAKRWLPGCGMITMLTDCFAC